MYIDTHAHYDHYRFRNERHALLPTLQQAGVAAVLNPAIDFDTNFTMVEKLAAYPWIHFALGIHPRRIGPWDAAQDALWESTLDQLLSTTPRVLAVGELGMDYHYTAREDVQERQEFWFRKLLRLAQRHQLPLVLHIREADADGLSVLHDFPLRESGVVHCFNEGWDIAKQYLDLGLSFGIGGSITLPEQTALRDAVRQMPLASILLETDAPFVKPHGWEPHNNNSLCLPEVAACIAACKGLTPEAVLQATTENAMRLFKFPKIEQMD